MFDLAALNLFLSPGRTSKADLDESVFLASDEEERTEQIEFLGSAYCLSFFRCLRFVFAIWISFGLCTTSHSPTFNCDHHLAGMRNHQEDSECETLPASDDDAGEPQAHALPPCPFESVSVPQQSTQTLDNMDQVVG